MKFNYRTFHPETFPDSVNHFNPMIAATLPTISWLLDWIGDSHYWDNCYVWTRLWYDKNSVVGTCTKKVRSVHPTKNSDSWDTTSQREKYINVHITYVKKIHHHQKFTNMNEFNQSPKKPPSISGQHSWWSSLPCKYCHRILLYPLLINKSRMSMNTLPCCYPTCKAFWINLPFGRSNIPIHITHRNEIQYSPAGCVFTPGSQLWYCWARQKRWRCWADYIHFTRGIQILWVWGCGGFSIGKCGNDSHNSLPGHREPTVVFSSRLYIYIYKKNHWRFRINM